VVENIGTVECPIFENALGANGGHEIAVQREKMKNQKLIEIRYWNFNEDILKYLLN
jgi:hypothetical protein